MLPKLSVDVFGQQSLIEKLVKFVEFTSFPLLFNSSDGTLPSNAHS